MGALLPGKTKTREDRVHSPPDSTTCRAPGQNDRVADGRRRIKAGFSCRVNLLTVDLQRALEAARDVPLNVGLQANTRVEFVALATGDASRVVEDDQHVTGLRNREGP